MWFLVCEAKSSGWGTTITGQLGEIDFISPLLSWLVITYLSP